MQVRIENSAKIPDELMQFVKKDTFSLIIKGAAGYRKDHTFSHNFESFRN